MDSKQPKAPKSSHNTWVADAIFGSGLSFAEVARRLTAQGLGNYDRSKVQKMTKDRKVTAEEEAAIARITGSARFELPAPDPYKEHLTVLLQLDDRAREHVFEAARLLLIARRPEKED